MMVNTPLTWRSSSTAEAVIPCPSNASRSAAAFTFDCTSATFVARSLRPVARTIMALLPISMLPAGPENAREEVSSTFQVLPLCAAIATVAPSAMLTAAMEPDCASCVTPLFAFSLAILSEPPRASVPAPALVSVTAPEPLVILPL